MNETLERGETTVEDDAQIPVRFSVLALASCLVGTIVMIVALTALVMTGAKLTLVFGPGTTPLQASVIVALGFSLLLAFLAMGLAAVNILRSVRSVFGWVMLVVIVLICVVEALGFQTVASLTNPAALG